MRRSILELDVKGLSILMNSRFLFGDVWTHYKTSPLRNLCLKLCHVYIPKWRPWQQCCFIVARDLLQRPPLWNINMTQFKTKVPEWRCFVVCGGVWCW